MKDKAEKFIENLFKEAELNILKKKEKTLEEILENFEEIMNEISDEN